MCWYHHILPAGCSLFMVEIYITCDTYDAAGVKSLPLSLSENLCLNFHILVWNGRWDQDLTEYMHIESIFMNDSFRVLTWVECHLTLLVVLKKRSNSEEFNLAIW